MSVFEARPTPRTAVVLVNLGTPQAPTALAVKRYLRQFLRDRRIITMPPVLWRPILELAILPRRSPIAAAKYASVWYESGSPLVVETSAQATALARRLVPPADGDPLRPGEPTVELVTFAMRYGQPDVGRVLADLASRGIERILAVPAYPQYSGTTIGSVCDAVGGYVARNPGPPEVRMTGSFPTDPGYIEAAAQRIEQTWQIEGRPDFAAGDRLILSFHGIPLAMDKAGDPYATECAATAALLRTRLGLDERQCLATFQSKFGPAPWLTPATINVVGQLGADGVGRVDVFCPGFAVDCLETLEEIGLLNRDAFMAAGGTRFVRIPCLNDSAAWIDALANIIRRHLSVWDS